MPFGSSSLLTLLVAVPYILLCEPIFFRKRRYFLRVKNRVAAVFILHVRPEALYLSSLAVAPEFRRRGVGTYILNYVERVGDRLGKDHVELSVLRKNLPARKLYEKLGFYQKQERRLNLILAKRIQKASRERENTVFEVFVQKS